MTKICVVTGGRMDYGHLLKLMMMIKNNPKFELLIIASCMHLAPEFGNTYKKIEEDGFVINKRVNCLLSSDNDSGICKSVGLATILFSECYEELKPDLLIVLGDRFEILAASQAALFMKIPIAHIAGGDTTEGAYDEAIRHSITKMSHIHFVTNNESLKRVRQLGENPNLVFNVGSASIDLIKETKFIDKNKLEELLDFKFMSKNILLTYHPVTLDNDKNDIEIILESLSELNSDIGIIITKSNADDNGRKFNQIIEEFCKNKLNIKCFSALGQFLYYNCINNVDVVIGNSSSGLYEVPSFKTPTINIGNRQKGRMRGDSIIDCPVDKDAIINAIYKSFEMDCSQTKNPYGTGNSSTKIIEILESIDLSKLKLQKHFFSI